MKQKMKKWKKALLITGIVLVSLVLLVFATISYIAEYLVEKYDVKYTGREIEMNWMFINLFTGYVHIDGLTVYEYQNDTVFFKASGINADLSYSKLFSKTYEITELTLNKPWARIVQSGQTFNFTDLIEKFTPDSTEVPDTTKPPTKVNVLNLEINDGEFHYIERNIPVNYFVKEVNVESPGYRWDDDLMDVKFNLLNGPGSGKIRGDANFNLENMDYKVAVQVDTFDLQIMEQYMRDLANYGRLRAFLDMDIKASGNALDETDLMATGMVKVNDIHFGKTLQEDYASIEQVHLQMREINPKHYRYIFDSAVIHKPYFKYERYDGNLDNIQTMFGIKGANVKAAQAAHDEGAKFNLILEIADFIQTLAENFLHSYYHADRVAIYDADIRFNDYTLTEKFWINAYPLNIEANSLDKYNKRMTATLKTGLQPAGNVYVAASINPQNYREFDITYHARQIPVAAFNPYLVSFTSYPADRGTVELKGRWDVNNGNINSQNNLLLLDPRFSQRLKRAGIQWVPMRFILSLLRSRGNVIDYDVPITGNLNDPQFDIWDIIGDVLTNIFVKPPSLGYILKTRTVERQLEKSLTLKWEMRDHELKPVQRRFMDRIGDFLVENPEASITVQPLVYEEKEKEAILFFEAKKKYYQAVNKRTTLTKEDTLAIDKMSNRDTLFLQYLDKHTSGQQMFTLQEKCRQLVGMQTVNARYNELMRKREADFRSYFVEKGVNDRIRVTAVTNSVPFNGFSYYKIDYKGDFPDKLLNAYYEMNDLNRTRPRREYRRKRERLGLPVMEVKEIKEKKGK